MVACDIDFTLDWPGIGGQMNGSFSGFGRRSFRIGVLEVS